MLTLYIIDYISYIILLYIVLLYMVLLYIVLLYIVLLYIVLLYIVLLYIVLLYIVLLYIVLLYIVLLYIVLLYIVLLYIVLLYIVLLYIVLLYIVLLYIVLLYIVLLYIVLLYIVLLYTNWKENDKDEILYNFKRLLIGLPPLSLEPWKSPNFNFNTFLPAVLLKSCKIKPPQPPLFKVVCASLFWSTYFGANFLSGTYGMYFVSKQYNDHMTLIT